MISESSLRERGKELFEAQRFADAADCYSEALSNLPEKGDEEEALKIRLNLAACFLRLDDRLEEAVELCDHVLAVDSSNAKALFRRGAARQSLAGKLRAGSEDQRLALQAARKDLVQAAKAEPSNRQVRVVLEEVSKALAVLPRAGAGFGLGSGLYGDRKPSEAAPPPVVCSTCMRPGHECCGKSSWIASRAHWLHVSEEEVAREPDDFEDDGSLMQVMLSKRPEDYEGPESVSDLSDDTRDQLEECLESTDRPYPQLKRKVTLTQAVHCAEEIWAED
eukprot:TRINITY_DN82416_c0_g1_i1.p1 TRINITY_DN82416_c0_g1~~TRINITY_DN82416_c0_g1_i1.p1  ORF type:complete len:278 (-),score=78.75 TRINITY_DN82416_c0_g1_i1:1-834(-)